MFYVVKITIGPATYISITRQKPALAVQKWCLKNFVGTNRVVIENYKKLGAGAVNFDVIGYHDKIEQARDAKSTEMIKCRDKRLAMEREQETKTKHSPVRISATVVKRRKK